MAHTIDHEGEIYKTQRAIEERHNRVLNTGRKYLSYTANIAKSLLPDPTSFQDVSEILLDMKTGMKVGGKIGSKGGPKGAAVGAVVGGVGYPIGKRVVEEVVPTLDELLGGVFRRNQWQPALVEAGTGAVHTPTPTNVKPVTHFSMSAAPNTQNLGKELESSYVDKGELARRETLKGPAFKMNRKELKAEIIRLQDEGMDFGSIKKQLLGDEPMWIDNVTGEPISLQRNTKDPKKTRFIGWRSRLKRGPKRTLLTEQQSVGPGETAFTKYNAKTNKVELLVKKGDEIHHWNSIIDKSSAYVGLSAQEAKELTGLVREAGWMFGDNKANLIKMVRGDHKLIHKFMRENGIEGAEARKAMEKLYEGKSVEDRFKILRGFMEHVQGAVDEELVRMGYQIPPSHAAAQAANREVLKTIKMP